MPSGAGYRRWTTGSNPYSWLVTGVIVAVAAVLRLAGLDPPKGYIFDEVYYPTDAWDMLQHGVEWDEKNNGPAYVVHPPLGKWLIALGEKVFGNTEVGWRVSGAIAGTLMILILIRVAYRLFHSIVLAGAAGLLMTVDGFQLVLSRTSLLDIFLGLFILATFAAWCSTGTPTGGAGCGRWRTASTRRPRRVPRIVPWWLLVAGVTVRAGLRREVERAVLRAVLRRARAGVADRGPAGRRASAGRSGPASSATWATCCSASS